MICKNRTWMSCIHSCASCPPVRPVDLRIPQPPAEQQRAARTAMRLDLLRCLAAAGRAADAISLYGSLLSEGAVREDDAGSRLSYATALQQVGTCTARYR